MFFDSSMAVILAWNLSGRDLNTFLTILGSGMVSLKLKVEFIMNIQNVCKTPLNV